MIATSLLLAPPVAFGIVLAAVFCLSWGFSRLSMRRTRRLTGPYACGEDIPSHMMQPDYGQFLPFALFFTILHVVALMATTVPVTTLASSLIVVTYVVGAVVGLFVLYSK